MTRSNTDEMPSCINHGEKMILTPVGPTCLSCVREKVDAENKAYARKASLQSYLVETYHLLKRRSVLTDDTLLDADFSNFETTYEEQETNLKKARFISSRVIEGKSVNLWLIGEPGQGKSHIAMAILKELNEAGKRRAIAAQDAGEQIKGKATSSLFVDFDHMLRLIRKSYNDKNSMYTEEYFINLCSEVDYLAIDDLGAETGSTDTGKGATDFVHRVLYAITNGRRGKTTIITTNLYKEEREEMYDMKILSRLSSNVAQIAFQNSPDMRNSAFEW